MWWIALACTGYDVSGPRLKNDLRTEVHKIMQMKPQASIRELYLGPTAEPHKYQSFQDWCPTLTLGQSHALATAFSVGLRGFESRSRTSSSAPGQLEHESIIGPRLSGVGTIRHSQLTDMLNLEKSNLYYCSGLVICIRSLHCGLSLRCVVKE